MDCGLLLITANTDSSGSSLLLFGISLGFLFFLIGFFGGWAIWRRGFSELSRLEDENRRLKRSARIRRKNFLKQQQTIDQLSRKD